MPLFFLFIGLLLVIIGINDRISDLSTLLKEDFKPSNGSAGFAVWIAVIAVVGMIGNSKSFKPVANAFLALIVIVIALSNKGFFAQLSNAVQNAASGSNPSDNEVVGSDGLSSGSSGGGGLFGGFTQLVSSFGGQSGLSNDMSPSDVASAAQG